METKKQYGNFGCDIDIKSNADALLERIKNYPIEVIYLMCVDKDWYSKINLSTDQNRFLQYPEYLGFRSQINEDIDERSRCFRGIVGVIKDCYEQNGRTPDVEELEWLCKESHYFKQMGGALIPRVEEIVNELKGITMPEIKAKVIKDSYYQWGAYILLFRLYAHLRNIFDLGYGRLSDITQMLEELSSLDKEFSDAYDLVRKMKNNNDSPTAENEAVSIYEDEDF